MLVVFFVMVFFVVMLVSALMLMMFVVLGLRNKLLKALLKLIDQRVTCVQLGQLRLNVHTFCICLLQCKLITIHRHD